MSQDAHGNTPLHLAVCQYSVPWEVVLDLVERGARVALANKEGVSPADLVPGGLLARLQDQMLAACWAGLHHHQHAATPQPAAPVPHPAHATHPSHAVTADPPSTGDGRSERE